MELTPNTKCQLFSELKTQLLLLVPEPVKVLNCEFPHEFLERFLQTFPQNKKKRDFIDKPQMANLTYLRRETNTTKHLKLY